MNNDLHELNDIDSLQFGLMSSNDILKFAVCEINSTRLSGPNSIYDSRLGTLDETHCQTCGQTTKQCTGHFGYIKLNTRVMNPLYNRLVVSVLKSICYCCSRLKYSEEKLHLNNIYKSGNVTRFQNLSKELEKVDICSHCKSFQPKYVFNNTDKTIQMCFRLQENNHVERIQLTDDEIYKIFANMNDRDIKLLGLKECSHPKDLILQHLLVLPTVSRPYVVTDEMTSDDDLSLQYIEIIKCNKQIEKNESEVKKNKFQAILRFRIRSLFDNTNQQQKTSSGRALKGIKKRLSGKEGIIRSNLCGKRVEKSGRTVIGPDVDLNVDEVGVPLEIANNLCSPVEVNQYNIQELQQLILDNKANYVIRKSVNDLEENRINLQYATHDCSNMEEKLESGDIIFRNKKPYQIIRNDSDKFSLLDNDVIMRNGKIVNVKHNNTRKEFSLRIGDIVERKMQNGDIILMNRQPTLHKGSMISQKVKILKGKTFRLNLAITESLNADFDGDEMNCYLPSDIPSQFELENLSTVDNIINSSSSNRANIKVVQDTPLAIYIMTKNKNPINKISFWKILGALKNFNYEHFQEKILIFKQEKKEENIFTGDFLFSLLLKNDFSFENNNLTISKGILTKGIVSKSDINKIISLLYLDYQNIDIVKEFINNVQFLSYAFLLYHGFSIGLQDCMIDNKNGKETIQKTVQKSIMKAKSFNMNLVNNKIKEVYTRFSLCEARDIGLSLAKKNLKETNGFRVCVESGAKGSFFNIAQISACLGQMEIMGERVQPILKYNRTLPHYPYQETLDDELEYESKGFIFSSFLTGLSPREFFFHSLTGREGSSLSIYLSTLFIYLSILSFIYLFIYLFLYLFICIYSSIFKSISKSIRYNRYIVENKLIWLYSKKNDKNNGRSLCSV